MFVIYLYRFLANKVHLKLIELNFLHWQVHSLLDRQEEISVKCLYFIKFLIDSILEGIEKSNITKIYQYINMLSSQFIKLIQK